MRQFVDVPRGEGAVLRDRLHPLQVLKVFREDPPDDLAPLDLGMGLHLAMQFRRHGEGNVGHRLDYVRTHNQTFGWHTNPATQNGFPTWPTFVMAGGFKSIPPTQVMEELDHVVRLGALFVEEAGPDAFAKAPTSPHVPLSGHGPRQADRGESAGEEVAIEEIV